MIRAIVIDDEQSAREGIALMLATHCPEVELLTMVDSVESGLIALREFEPDVVFLDIEMPGQSGFNLLEQMVDASFSVIFTTAYHEYAIRAIRFSALDYLLKPIGISELKDAVRRVGHVKQTSLQHASLLESLKTDEVSTIFLNTQTGALKKKISEILRFEADGSYTYVCFTDGKKILISRSLRYFEELLEQKGFMRCHRSHFVNMEHVVEMHKKTAFTLVLSDESLIPVSHRKKAILLNYFGN